jgi:hypothetical protein
MKLRVILLFLLAIVPFVMAVNFPVEKYYRFIPGGAVICYLCTGLTWCSLFINTCYHTSSAPRWTSENRPYGDTSKPANGRQNQNNIIYNLGEGVPANIFMRLSPAGLCRPHLGGGYGNAGMRPERRLSSRNGGRLEPPFPPILARKR